ncbi:hypothetical protein GCM10009133_04310 [Cocleimonas flava]|uniref:Pilus assembly protein CpaF n=1 Tax=Cocleimonas flava TaxID=634765 RepID=A0A4R1F7X8_9GAMM|nr:ATPase, T2SS/T4P/T4SS family [Cocleimonas flava]TCJ86801.1 pilus assembly protein CpaF [Cocleimonas flava]
MFEVEAWTAGGKKVEKIVCHKKNAIIGKAPDSQLRLYGWRIGSNHAQLVEAENGVYIYNNKSKGSSTFVNDSEYEEYGPLSSDDEIRIHNYIIKVTHIGATKKEVPINDIEKANNTNNAHKPLLDETNNTAVISREVDASNIEKQKLYKLWQVTIHEQLLQQMDLRRLAVHEMSDEDLRSLTEKILIEVIDKNKNFPVEIDKKELTKRALAEAIGLGPIEPMLEDDSVSEIMVNSAEEIYYEKDGKLYKSDVTFSSNQAVLYAIERIVTPLGRRIDESSPLVDARLKDGSRVNAIIPPLALKGPSITIRKFMKQRLHGDDLVRFGSVSKEMMEFINMAVANRQNIIVSGGTGSGKTTLLNILSNKIPDNERVVTIEDSAELRLYQPNLVSLESRPPNQDGKGEVNIRDLVKNSLRMRPDRIVVGECRGGEALDMMQAMNTGHDGSLTTLHANNATDCLSRLEVLILMAEMDLPSRAIREQIASSVDIIIQQTRFPCGSRKITSISEVSGIDSGRIQLGEIFRFEQNGYGEDDKVKGKFIATGQIPGFYEELRSKGLPVNVDIFDKGRVVK